MLTIFFLCFRRALPRWGFVIRGGGYVFDSIHDPGWRHDACKVNLLPQLNGFDTEEQARRLEEGEDDPSNGMSGEREGGAAVIECVILTQAVRLLPLCGLVWHKGCGWLGVQPETAKQRRGSSGKEETGRYFEVLSEREIRGMIHLALAVIEYPTLLLSSRVAWNHSGQTCPTRKWTQVRCFWRKPCSVPTVP